MSSFSPLTSQLGPAFVATMGHLAGLRSAWAWIDPDWGSWRRQRVWWHWSCECTKPFPQPWNAWAWMQYCGRWSWSTAEAAAADLDPFQLRSTARKESLSSHWTLFVPDYSEVSLAPQTAAGWTVTCGGYLRVHCSYSPPWFRCPSLRSHLIRTCPCELHHRCFLEAASWPSCGRFTAS